MFTKSLQDAVVKMLAARGVSLGLGKINLSELNQLPVADRALLGKISRLKKKAVETKPRFVVKKQVDKQTLWVACRAVSIGSFIIAIGLVMTVVGYFDKDLTTSTVFNMTTGEELVIMDSSLRYQIKSLQYTGPILMGIGMFLLIIACVVTLESRDRHAQIIQEESDYQRVPTDMMNSGTKSSLLPADESENAKNNNGRLHPRMNHSVLPDRPQIDSDVDTDRSDDNGKAERKKSAPREVQKAAEGRSTLSGRLSQSVRSLRRQMAPRPEAAESLNRSDERLQKTGVLLSTVNLKRPKGRAPIAHFDSQLEMPFSSASCSTIGTRSGEPKE